MGVNSPCYVTSSALAVAWLIEGVIQEVLTREQAPMGDDAEHEWQYPARTHETHW